MQKIRNGCVLLAVLCLAGVVAGEPKTPDEIKPPAGDIRSEAEVRKLLNKKVTFEFVDTPAEEALAFLRSLTGTTMIVDPVLTADGITATPVNLRVQDMEVVTALNWVMRLIDAEAQFRDGAIFITRNPATQKQAAEQARKQEQQEEAERKVAQRMEVTFPEGYSITLEGPLARDHASPLLERIQQAIDAKRPSTSEVLLLKPETELGNPATQQLAAQLMGRASPDLEITREAGLWLIVAKDPQSMKRIKAVIEFFKANKIVAQPKRMEKAEQVVPEPVEPVVPKEF